MRRRIVAVIAAAGCVAMSGVAASSAAAANTLGPPPWKGSLCPAIGLDTGCQYGIDVTAVGGSGAATTQTIAQDGDQPSYDGVEDAMVVIKNDASSPLASLHMGIPNSFQNLFGFDGDGLCTGSANGTVTWTPPAGCGLSASPDPSYQLTGYEGPGVWFNPDASGPDSGAVEFNPALAPGQTAYYSLETEPNVVPTAGTDNNWQTSVIAAPGQQPSSFVSVPTGTSVTDQVTINGQFGAANGAVPGDGSASGTVTYKLFANDNSCSSAPVYTSAPKAVTAGIAAPSDPVGAQLASGRYYWLENYSGDANNTPSQSICGAEILDVGATAVVTKLSSSTVSPGTPVSDSALLLAAVPQAISGTISFAVYTDAACKIPYPGVPSTFSAITPTNGSAKSGPISLPSGTYYWVASYTGDPKNAAGASACGAEVLHVANSSFTIVHKPKVGKGYKVTFTVAVTDPGKFSWAFTTPNKHGLFAAGDLQATAAAKHCGKGKIKVKHKCVPAIAKYGSGSRQVKPGNVTVTITPSHKLRSALNKGSKVKLTGLLTFQSSFGGLPTSQTVHVTVHGKKHHKHHKHH